MSKFQTFYYNYVSLCGTKCKVKRNTDRNGKNYCLNGFLRGQFLDSKAKTRGIAQS